MMTLTLLMMMQFFAPSENIYDFSFQTIDGRKVEFSEFKGKKVLIVNTASKCGFTKQYKDLQTLHDQYGDKLVVIGFPANNFGQQEPGSNEEIQEFCEINYGVTFLIAEKTEVKGVDISPIFKFLTHANNPDFVGDINWNFEKFLLDEEGNLIHRYRSKVNPMDDTITSHLK